MKISTVEKVSTGITVSILSLLMFASLLIILFAPCSAGQIMFLLCAFGYYGKSAVDSIAEHNWRMCENKLFEIE